MQNAPKKYNNDPHFNPHYGRPFDKPVIGGCQSPEHPLIGAARIISLAGRLQKAFPDIAVVGSGYSWFRTLTPGVAVAALAKAGINNMEVTCRIAKPLEKIQHVTRRNFNLK
jgi:hypothetical protein